MSSSLEGRVAVVFGVANKRSIAWSIAQGLHQAGAKVVITYQNERLELEAKDLIASCHTAITSVVGRDLVDVLLTGSALALRSYLNTLFAP